MRSIQPKPALEGNPMLSFLSTIIAGAVAAPLPEGMTVAQANAQNARGRATHGNRLHKKATHAALLDSVDGDREALKTITVWVPRKTMTKLMARAFDKKACYEGGERFQDAQYEVESTEYDLEEIEVERARHPDEEVAFAKLQKRFREPTRSILGFFHKPTTKHGDRRQRNVLPAPLGDFNWVDLDATTAQANAETRAQRLERSLRKIRNLKESLA